MSEAYRSPVSKKPDWKYCVVGNITESHLDEEGALHRGTKAFTPGTKVYLCGKYWDTSKPEIEVIGLNRFGRYVLESIPVQLIESVRISKVYRQTILNIMYDWEFEDSWWGHYKRDKKDIERFLSLWNQRFSAQ